MKTSSKWPFFVQTGGKSYVRQSLILPLDSAFAEGMKVLYLPAQAKAKSPAYIEISAAIQYCRRKAGDSKEGVYMWAIPSLKAARTRLKAAKP